MDGRREGPGLRTMSAGAAAATVGVLPVYMLGGLAVQIGENIELGATRLGITVAAFFAASALGSAPFGRVVERIGSYRTSVGGAMVANLALLAIGGAWSWAALLVLVTTAGLANAMLQVSVNLLIVRGVPAARQGIAFGVKLAAIPISTLVAGAAVPLVGLTVGWRWAFAGGAVLALGVVPLTPGFEPRLREDDPAAAGVVSSPRAALVMLAAAGGLGTAAANCLGAFLVDWSVTAGTDPGRAGWLLAAASVAGILVRLVAGWWADRRHRPALPTVCGMLALGAVGFAIIGATGVGVGLVVGTLVAFAAGWGWNGLYNLAIVRHNEGAPAGATGVTQTGVYLGSMAGPLAFGVIAAGESYPAAWTAAAGAAATAAVLVVIGDRWMRSAAG